MAETSKQLQDIEALLAERRKYEQWIAQLESRRAATPEHVYRKVRGDYDARLAEAQERLAAETGAVRALVADLEASRAKQDAQLGLRSDERSEAELRASVGEYGEQEWEKLRGTLDTAIAEMTQVRDATQVELDGLRTLLAEAEASSAKTAAPAEAAKPAAAEVREVHVTAVAPPPAADAPTARAPKASVAVPALPDRPATRAAPPVAPVAPAPRASGAMPAPELENAPAGPRPDFDELAFLKSVVGRTTPPTSPSGTSTIVEPGARATAAPVKRNSSTLRASTPGLRATPDVPDAPLEPSDDVKRESGAFQASNLSTFGGKTPRSSEAIKSLKCAECGTLNYPTEWYCERCGGELAAF